MSSKSADEAGPHLLKGDLAGGAASSHAGQSSRDADGCPAREQRDSYASLRGEICRLRRRNISLENELHEQRTNYSLLAGDMLRVCDEMRRLLEERDGDRDPSTLSGSQCWGATAEQNKRGGISDSTRRICQL